jgi:hypothetical protein
MASALSTISSTKTSVVSTFTTLITCLFARTDRDVRTLKRAEVHGGAA